MPSRLQVKAAMKRLQEIAAEVHASTVAGPEKGVDAQGGASKPVDETTAAEGEFVEGLCLQSLSTPFWTHLHEKCLHCMGPLTLLMHSMLASVVMNVWVNLSFGSINMLTAWHRARGRGGRGTKCEGHQV